MTEHTERTEPVEELTPFELMPYTLQAELFRLESRELLGLGQQQLDIAEQYVSGKRLSPQGFNVGVHFTFAQSFFMKAQTLATLALGVIETSKLMDNPHSATSPQNQLVSYLEARKLSMSIANNDNANLVAEQPDAPINIKEPRTTPRIIS